MLGARESCSYVIRPRAAAKYPRILIMGKANWLLSPADVIMNVIWRLKSSRSKAYSISIIYGCWASIRMISNQNMSCRVYVASWNMKEQAQANKSSRHKNIRYHLILVSQKEERKTKRKMRSRCILFKPGFLSYLDQQPCHVRRRLYLSVSIWATRPL